MPLFPLSANRRSALSFLLSVLVFGAANAQFIANQPVGGSAGTMRWSKLWIDPVGDNNLDGDAIVYQDFTLGVASQIQHIEWWGDAQPDLGFQIEFWRQDPGTIAYQPYGVYRGTGAQAEYKITTMSFTASSDPSGTTHFSFDFPTPVSLSANDAGNPRWFVDVIGLTDVAYLEWNWAQGLGGSNRSFQFIRGGTLAGGDLYQGLPEGRALVMTGSPVPEPGSLLIFGLASTLLIRRSRPTSPMPERL